MTSLANIFTIEKALDQISFGYKRFICEPIFIFCVAHFRIFGMQKDDKIIFVNGCLRTR